jgi:formate dehydrogenase major subunit
VFSDRFPTATGLGKMVPAEVLPPDEQPDAEYPYILSTGRQLEHWHTGSMTRRSYVLDAVNPEPIVQMSSRDILKLGIKPGDMVRIASRRGEIEIMVREDNQVPPGAVFIPFAFVEAAANELTNPKLDPFGKIPEFKFCAVKVEPAAAGHMEAAE